MNQHIENGNKDEADSLLPELESVVDRAVSKNVIHKNKAARIKSKFSRRVNDLS